MFFKPRTRKITELEKLDAILEYLNNEMTRWQNTLILAGPLAPEEWTNKVNARIKYLEEQIIITRAYRAIESINPNKK